MTYQALARKWRPQDFTSLIGQDPVVTALRNALTDGRIAQAYLFAGIRGVGKTTAARVLAKALNCENGPAGDPCCHCDACTQITDGADLDVLEIDAATYSKVEQVRELTESLRYGPARSRYKVVVLDEVHRLSRQAFDALLKIVEEPPPHLVFIFATTEIEAVPATILSRCQEYHFRRVPANILTEHLQTLATAESISVSDHALQLIARAGDGSVRDAVALLDQLATYGAGTIVDEDAGRLLAGFDPALFHNILEATLDGNGPTLAKIVKEIESEGRDPRQIFSGLLSYGRDGLHLALGSPIDSLELPLEEAQRLAQLAKKAGYENLLRWTHLLLQSETLIRRSEASALALEIALLRVAELPKVVRVEEILGGPLPPTSGTSTPENPPTTPSEMTPKAGAPKPSAALSTPTANAMPTAPQEKEAPGVEDLLMIISRDRQVLAAHLRQAQRLHLEGQILTIFQDPEDHWLEQALQRTGNRKTLDSALVELFGSEANWTVQDGDRVPGTTNQEVPPETPETEPDDTVLQAVLQIFDGTVERTPSD